MDNLTVRQAISSDIPDLVKLDHDYSSDHVWQMSLNRGPEEVGVVFREVRLPRPMRVAYPHDPERLPDEWTRLAGLLVAESGEARLGYLALSTRPGRRRRLGDRSGCRHASPPSGRRGTQADNPILECFSQSNNNCNIFAIFIYPTYRG